MDDATKSSIIGMVEKGVHLVSRVRQTALASCFRDQDTEAEGWAANMRRDYGNDTNLPHRHYTVQDEAELSRTLAGEPELQIRAIPSHSSVTEEEYEIFVKQTKMWTSFIRYKVEFPDANAAEFRAAWPEESEWEMKAVAEKSMLQVLTRCCGGLSMDLDRERAKLDD
ncbi:hypothetical protein JCM24511_01309 [Saitozyma sp. JCM 24511]|nr:hypothetical protein JCM24511_01309 [Saitozyma sp. JCM 24511]